MIEPSDRLKHKNPDSGLRAPIQRSAAPALKDNRPVPVVQQKLSGANSNNVLTTVANPVQDNRPHVKQLKATPGNIVQRAKWCGMDIPDNVGGAPYEGGDANGFYHLDKTQSIRMILNGLGLSSLHLHMVDSTVVVTMTQKSRTGAGETTAHNNFTINGKVLKQYFLATGTLAQVPANNQLAYAAIAMFARAANLGLQTNLPHGDFASLGQQHGGPEYATFVKNQQEALQNAIKEKENSDRKNEMFVELKQKKMMLLKRPFLTRDEENEVKEEWKRLLAKPEQPAESPSSRSKRKGFENEETTTTTTTTTTANAPEHTVEVGEKQEGEVVKKPKRAFSINLSQANKILNIIKKDTALQKKVSFTQKNSNREVAKKLLDYHGTIEMDEINAAIAKSGVSIDQEYSVLDILQALNEAVQQI